MKKGIITERSLNNYKELKKAGWLVNTDHPNGAREGTDYVLVHCRTIYIVLDKCYNENITLIRKLIRKQQSKVITLDDGTKKAINGKKLTVKVKFQNQWYDITASTEWYNHPIYLHVKESTKEFFKEQETINNIKRLSRFDGLYNTKDIPDEEIERFCRTFSTQYQIEYNPNCIHELYATYCQLMWYIDNDIPYNINPYETENNIPPEETPFNECVFIINPNEQETIIESIGEIEIMDRLIHTH